MLDSGSEQGYAIALESALAAVQDAEQTYSARLLQSQRETGLAFADFGLQLARDYRDYFLGLPDDFNQHLEALETEAVDSLQKQRDVEEGDDLSLDEYLERYYA